MIDERNPEPNKPNPENEDKNSHQERVSESIHRTLQQPTADNNQNRSSPQPIPSFPIRLWHSLWRRRRWRKIGKADHPGPSWAEITSMIFTGGIVIAAFIQLHIYQQQEQTMTDALGQNERNIILGQGQLAVAARNAATAQSASTTASETLTNEKTTFQVEQRPYIVGEVPQFLSPFSANTPVKANITIMNIGKTPAFRVVWHVELAKYYGEKGTAGREKLKRFLLAHYEQLNQKNSATIKELAGIPMQLSPRQDLAPNTTLFTTNTENIIFGDELPVLQTDDSTIVLLYMSVEDYLDSRGNPYRTQTCHIFWGSDQKTWHFCDTHNTIQ